MPTTVEKVQRAILQDAADLANQWFASEFDTERFVRGEIYRPDPIQSQAGGLCLSLDEMIVSSLDPTELAEVRANGLRAIRQAIMDNRDDFVGIIIGESRAERNYFSRFPTETGQGKLF